MKFYNLVLLAIFLTQAAAFTNPTPDGPVAPPFNQTYVAIITQPVKGFDELVPNTMQNNSYIAGSYVQYVEQTGAQAILVPYDLPWDELTHVLDQTNGQVFPGGGGGDGASGNLYSDRMFAIYNYAVTKNVYGKYYFIWAVCLGFQQMLINMADYNPNVIVGGFDDEGEHKVKIESQKKWQESKLFGKVDQYKTLHVFSQRDLVYHHKFGITPEGFAGQRLISSKAKMLATSAADNGKEYVAIYENRIYPFFATQFHPEKNQFEKKAESFTNLDRSKVTINVASGFITELVNLSRELRDYEIGDLDMIGKAYRAFNFIRFPYLGEYFESWYLIGKMTDCESGCYKRILDSKYEDKMIDIYRNLRNLLIENEKNKTEEKQKQTDIAE